jgi:hypothetical protein
MSRPAASSTKSKPWAFKHRFSRKQVGNDTMKLFKNFPVAIEFVGLRALLASLVALLAGGAGPVSAQAPPPGSAAVPVSDQP